jgi:hypothetical protein
MLDGLQLTHADSQLSSIVGCWVLVKAKSNVWLQQAFDFLAESERTHYIL